MNDVLPGVSGAGRYRLAGPDGDTGASGIGQSQGFHGNAIFSRFPILRSRAVRLPIYYDWFWIGNSVWARV